MSKDEFTQAVYDDLHDREYKVPKKLKHKVKNWYNRVNFFDDYEVRNKRKVKDYKRGK